ncbi:sensor histidine kinase [Maridesulfovibrio sp. FT414]|uniref:sensor histidine kinase n=1 Tax=Maridesulfovibrio sp. FT414 TaxID=2979469 RepID=UPI003D80646A
MGSSALQKDRDGLCFFGQISAAISHDLKNVLAIINEDAGLLQDFSIMATQGMELDPQRLIKLAEKIQGQIRRGDSIIKNMNRFAHSVDLPECEVDFHELTALVISLLTRMASRKCVNVVLDDNGPVKGKGDPFTIQRLIALTLESCMDSGGRDSELKISVTGADGVSTLRITGLNEQIPAERLGTLNQLAETAGASIGYSPQEKVLLVKF